MTNYDTLANIKRSAYGQVANKSVIIKAVNFKNYPTVESSDENGYTLVSYDEDGNLSKSQYHKWRNTGKTKMDYNSKEFQDAIKRKKALSKFLSIQIGESAEYIMTSMKQSTQVSSFSGEMEDCWIVALKGVDPEIPNEVKNWSVTSLAVVNQFIDQKIKDGDKIKIERQPKGDKSKYVVTKIS